MGSDQRRSVVNVMSRPRVLVIRTSWPPTLDPQKVRPPGAGRRRAQVP
jgi:hypothetical protein